MPVASSSSTPTGTDTGTAKTPTLTTFVIVAASSTASLSASARTVTVCAVAQFCGVNASVRVSGVESLSTVICGLSLVAVTVTEAAGRRLSATS